MTSPELGTVTIHRIADGVWIVELHGEHDLTTAGDLHGHLETILTTGTTVMVDMTAATFMAQRLADLNPGGGHLAVVAPEGGFPARLFDLVDPSFPDAGL